MNKPNPKPRRYLRYDYERKTTAGNIVAKLAAEYAELRTRTPGGRG